MRRRIRDASRPAALIRASLAPACCAVIIAVGVGSTAGCGDVNGALERLSQARDLSADLLVQFTKATDASNRAVMADTDDASIASAHEAEQAKQAVHRDVDALGPMLQGLNYADETRVLQAFAARFAEYDELDRRILDLAVENTNLKAQRLSFGPSQDAADAFRDALMTPALSVAEKDAWRARALVATAIGAVREIQALQAPHIAEADDAAMARIEKRMAASDAAARDALKQLSAIVESASTRRVAAATTALDRFTSVNAQILDLSHRNTNVRSLALSLSQKPALVNACDDQLRSLQSALAKRGYLGARWK